MGIERGSAMVYKDILIQYAKQPARLEGYLRHCGKAVLCKIMDSHALPNDPLPPGRVWIVLKKGRGGTSRFAIPREHVYVRHRFLKPYIPLDCFGLAEALEEALKVTGQRENSRYEEWQRERAKVLMVP
jgi:hypothetical protein